MTAVLPSAYLAPTAYYRLLNRTDAVVIERFDNYERQSWRNRCTIAAANGPQTLTVPVEKPAAPRTPLRDIRIANHGNWQHVHWTAIVSAYRSSPFFDFLADDFRPFYEKPQTFLFDLNEGLRRTVCRLLDISPNISYSDHYIDCPPASDFRKAFNPKRPTNNTDEKPYYQVFAGRHGFLPDLSVIDLLFNMGPEGVMWL